MLFRSRGEARRGGRRSCPTNVVLSMQCWNLNCLYHFGITRLLVPTTNPPPNSGSQFHLTLYSKIPPLLHLNVSPPPNLTFSFSLALTRHTRISSYTSCYALRFEFNSHHLFLSLFLPFLFRLSPSQIFL